MGSMPPEPAPGATGTSTGATLVIDGYRIDSDEIPQQFRRSVREFVSTLTRILQSNAGSTIVVTLVGHTDSSGTERHNTPLGLNRALGVSRAVQKLMPQQVASQVRYLTRSGGESSPVAPNVTTRDRARNRRVVVRADATMPVAPKPKPRPRRRGLQPTPILSTPCLKFRQMNEIFGSTYKVLFNLENSTAMHFPKAGRPVLVRKDAGRLSDYIGATTGAILDKVRGELEEAVIQDSILLDKVAAWTFALETGSMLERQRRYDAMSGNPAGADAKRMHRLLVAEQFARAGGSYNLFARAYDLVNLMGRYEQLNQDCVRSRGPQVKEPRSWRRTSPEYLPRSPGDV